MRLLADKTSWRGSYSRVLRLSDCEGFLETLDPATGRLTNRWPLADVLRADVRSATCIVIAIANGCGATCGLLSQQLRFSLPDPAAAAAAASAVRSCLVRHLSPEDSERARMRSEEAAVLSAMPRELSPLSPRDLSPLGQLGGSSTRFAAPLAFDVQVTLNKARNLPPPGALCASGPRVDALWGGPLAGSSRAAHGVVAGGPVAGRPPRLPGSRRGLAAGADGMMLPGSLGEASVSATGADGGDGGWRDASHGAPVQWTVPEGEGDPCNPRWGGGGGGGGSGGGGSGSGSGGFEACFGYTATEAQLRSRSLHLRVYLPRWGLPPIELGTCSVCLYDVATGPLKFDLPMASPAGGGGGGNQWQSRLVFSVEMVQHCELSVTLPAVSCLMRSYSRHTSQASQEAAHRDSAFSLSVSLTMGDEESQPTRADFERGSLKLTEKGQLQLSIVAADRVDPRIALLAQTSAKAFEQESLRLCVWEAQKTYVPGGGDSSLAASVLTRSAAKLRLLGEVWLPITKVYSPADEAQAERAFDEVLWLHGQRIGRLEGTVTVMNGPKVVQLPGGFFTEHGILPLGPIASGLVAPSSAGPTPSSAAHANGGVGSPRNGPAGAPFDATTFEGGLGHELRGVDFEKMPPGLAFPKEVELLLSLVQSLRKVILDLHLDSATPASRVPQVGAASASEPSLRDADIAAADERGWDLDRRPSATAHLDSPASGRGVVRDSRLRHAEMASRRLAFLQSRLQLLLGLSSKESTKAFFYDSVQALQWTQRLMLRLWAYLVSQVEHMAYRYQPAVFETLHALMSRGELDCSAMLEAPAPLLERYRRVLWDTIAYVVTKLSRKAAPAEVRDFCSHALALGFFRLPSLRYTLLSTILPPGENTFKHVREWNLPWSLQKAAVREAQPPGPRADSADAEHAAAGAAPRRVPWLARRMPSGLGVGSPPSSSASSPPSSSPFTSSAVSGWLAKGVAGGLPLSSTNGVCGAASCACGSAASTRQPAGSARKALPSVGEVCTVDQWTSLWQARPNLDSSSAQAERSLGGRYWRERLRKRGHCFFLLLEHWVHAAPIAMGYQPGEPVIWKEVPGYPSLVKAFLLEMKQRPVHLWPESMVSTLVSLVSSNRQLLHVTVRILLSRVSSLHLRPSLAVLQRLSSLMSAVASEPLPQAFSADRLLHHTYLMAESDHFKVAASALIFIYNHLDALGDGWRIEALSWLHARFGHFALHWSRVVRTIFLHVVVIRVLHYVPPPVSSSRAGKGSNSGALSSLSHGGLSASSDSLREQLRAAAAAEALEASAAARSADPRADPRRHSHDSLSEAQRAAAQLRSESPSAVWAASSPAGQPGLGALSDLNGQHALNGSRDSLHANTSGRDSGLGRTYSHDSRSSHSSLATLTSVREMELVRIQATYEASIAALEQLAHADTDAAAAIAAQALGLGGAAHDPLAASPPPPLGSPGGRPSPAFPVGGPPLTEAAMMPPPFRGSTATPPPRGTSRGSKPASPHRNGAVTAAGGGGCVGAAVRNYAAFAWSEYLQVVRKYEAAHEAAQLERRQQQPPSPATPVERLGGERGLGRGSREAKTMTRSSSFGALTPADAGAAGGLRRVASEPMLPQTAPVEITLSLSMISAHQDDDDDGPSDEW